MAEKERRSFGEEGALSYTASVTADPALPDDEAADLAPIEGMSVFEMIGELLAALAGIFERRLGGPGAFRRLLSVLAAFVTFMVRVRQLAVARQVRALASVSPLQRHLSHPPAGWAAP